jgi:hypothetical protein
MAANNRHTLGIVHAGFRGKWVFVARKKSQCNLINFHLIILYDIISLFQGFNKFRNSFNKCQRVRKIND